MRFGVRVPRRATVTGPAAPQGGLLTRPKVDERTDTRLDDDTVTEKGKHAHIVKVDPGEDAAAKVLEARIYGYPVEALCGHRWVPSKDPKQLPICEECKQVYELYRGFNGKLPETPRS